MCVWSGTASGLRMRSCGKAEPATRRYAWSGRRLRANASCSSLPLPLRMQGEEEAAGPAPAPAPAPPPCFTQTEEEIDEMIRQARISRSSRMTSAATSRTTSTDKEARAPRAGGAPSDAYPIQRTKTADILP